MSIRTVGDQAIFPENRSHRSEIEASVHDVISFSLPWDVCLCSTMEPFITAKAYTVLLPDVGCSVYYHKMNDKFLM